MAYRTKPLPAIKTKLIPSDGNFCYICGKKIKSKRYYQIHVVDGGGYVLHNQDEEIYSKEGDPRADLGGWNVGSDCARKLGNDYITRAG
jgi:hypothetical protein